MIEFKKYKKLLCKICTAAFVSIILSVVVVGCAEQTAEPYITDPMLEPSQVSIDLVSVESKNGNRSHRVSTPLMEHYGLADNPFTEFTRGIMVETYNDSTMSIEGDLRGDYAHYDEKLELWEVRGNVVANNYSGDRRLYGSQLWWDEKEDRIYSHKQVRVIEGKSTHLGIGFEADGGFNRWSFRSPRGQMEVEQPDSSRNDSVIVRDSL